MSSPYFGLSATQGLGPHHAPPSPKKSLAKVLKEHDATHNPELFTSAKPPKVTKASQPKSFSGVAKAKQSQEAAARKQLAAQYGDKFAKAPGWAQKQLVDKYLAGEQNKGPMLQTVLGAPKHGVSEAATQKALLKTYKQNHPLGQQIISGIANTVPGVALGKALENGKVHPSTLGHEALNDITSGLVPVGKAAAILGPLKGFQRVKAGAEAERVAESVSTAKKVLPPAPIVRTIPPKVSLPEGTLFHGSPEGELKGIDTFYHTKPWREGPGFYATTSPEKAAKYAAGKTASAERRGGPGALNVVKLKPGAKVLDMDAQPESFWRGLASKIIGEPIDEARWKEWARDIHPSDSQAKGASEGVLNRMRLLHILTGYDEMPKTDAYYAIEEALHSEGYQATKHLENGVPVYIVKDENAIEHLGAHKAGDLLPRKISIHQPGFALPSPQIAPVVTKGVPEGASVVRGALKGAKVLRGKQEAGYSAERSARVATGLEHLNNPELTPAERIAGFKAAQAGELPKINFQGFSELNDKSLQALQEHVLNHPHLLPYQKLRASEALTNALAGKVPTKSELTLLEHVFGKDTAVGLGQISEHPLRDKLLSALNIPRSLMASFDLSAPFRQGLMVSTRHPGIFFKNFGPMLKAFGSEKVYDAMLADIHARPSYPMMVEAKLGLTQLSKSIGNREEQFASDYAEKIPGIGHGVRASGRAYTGFLDKTRADVFDHLIQQAQSQGINVQDQKFLRSLGSYINSATGRGDLGKFQEAGKVLNAVFFSPRLLASRLNFLNPAYYARLDPFARKEALRSAIQLAGTLTTLLGLASQIPGVKVVSDPRNPDWGKIKMGDTRIDLGGGFQQPLRLLAQLSPSFMGGGVAISSTTGKKLNLTANGYGQPTRLDLFLRFFEGKESPIASVVTDKLRNSDQVGHPFSVKNELTSHMIPLLFQDVHDLYKNKGGGLHGLELGAAGFGVGSVGFGLQTYGPKKPKETGGSTPQSYFGGGSSGGSDYFGSSGSGGSAYFGG